MKTTLVRKYQQSKQKCYEKKSKNSLSYLNEFKIPGSGKLQPRHWMNLIGSLNGCQICVRTIGRQGVGEEAKGWLSFRKEEDETQILD